MSGFISFLKSFLSKEIIVIIVSMLPLIELRGAIPIGIGLGMSFYESLVISFIGSTIPAILIVYLIKYVFFFLRKLKFFDNIITKIEVRTLSKREQIDKYGYWGLFLFVAIPLPGTGVWSGSLLSYLLGMKKLKSLAVVILGNLVAGVIIAIISNGAFNLIR